MKQIAFKLCFAALIVVILGSPAVAEDRFWILWERIKLIGQNCPNGVQCIEKKTYSSRPLNTDNKQFIYRLFGLTNGRLAVRELPGDHPGAPVICTRNQTKLTLGFDPEVLPRSVKIEVLRGVRAVFVDLRNLSAPPGFTSAFGETLHRQFVGRLEEGGIRVVTKDELPFVPGQPTLNIYFSFTDPDDVCDYEYSVFASLSQDVLLARDLRIKIAAGVWSFSTGSTAKDHSGDESDAILGVAEAFVRDYRQVNIY